MTAAHVWKDLPEINRRVAFTSHYTPLNLPLGCHCSSISGVSIDFGTSYHAANNGRNVEVLDTTKEPQLAYKKDIYTGYDVPPDKEIELVKTFLLKKESKYFDSIKADAYEIIIKSCSSTPLWVMSDVINYSTPVRKLPTGRIGGQLVSLVSSTGEFAKYLIKKKIGYVMASPIVQNPSHRMKDNYSLNQGWFWIPPRHLTRAINVSNEYGEEKFPDKENWISTIGSDLNLIDPQIVLESVLVGGVFPEDKRFKQKRDARGRFLAKPKISEA